MAFQLGTNKTASKPTSYFPIILLISFLLILSITADDQNTKTTNIGAIIDADSRTGKEQRTAMEIAVENFNDNSMNQKFSLIFRNSGRDPLQAAYAAEELIKEKQAQVIIGMETWQEASLVATIGNKAQVPVLSFASASTKPPLLQLQWPFLIQMATKSSEQMNCIAAILHSYKWKRVIAIYEDSGDSGMLNLLSEALQSVGTEIEYSLAFPPLSSLSDPEGYVLRETVKLLKKSSRVFIVLESSLTLANHFFREAKELGLMGKDSVWIVTDNSVVSFKEGALGIESYYSNYSEDFLNFKIQFQKEFKLKHPDEAQDHSYPGIHALRAYDSISTISHAMKGIDSEENTSKTLLNTILSSTFTGLSGDIRFQDGSLSPSPIFKIVNIVGTKNEELGFWSSKIGFSNSPNRGENINGGESMEVWGDLVKWPGNLNRVPKGWAMPSDANPMMIGVPGKSSFGKFVKVESDGTVKGFSITVFEEVVKILEKDYPLPYKFVPYNDGSYGDLIDHVINKTYDAVVGDVTILANRSEYVEFTQPYTESGLKMIVPVKSHAHKAWLFLKPFTREMWIVSCVILIYTMVIVWSLEHQTNPEFRGPWKNQLGTALWFTFSTLFFVHTEKLHSNITRVVVVVWLFVVMVLTSSYTASLSAMLTVPRLEPTVKDIGWLLRTNATVGCDGDSFVKTYLKDVLKFEREDIKNISSPYDYPKEFKSGNIKAAFLELPYEKLFLKEYCNEYTVVGPSYRFGGLGFVFQKGSPIASDVSKAILELSEKGELKKLEDDWLGTSSICSNNEATNTDSLTLHSFQALFLFSAGISTLSLLIFLIRYLRRNREKEAYTGDKTLGDESILGNAVRTLATRSLGRNLTSAQQRRSSKWEHVSTSDDLDDFHSSQQIEIEMEMPINKSS